MAVTRSWETGLIATAQGARKASRRALIRDLFWLACASVFVAAALLLCYRAKTQDFPLVEQQLMRGGIVNLNRLTSPDQLLPFLQIVQDAQQRREIATQIFDIAQKRGSLRNVGQISELSRRRKPPIPLSKLKPEFIVRTPQDFRIQFAAWIALYFAAFYAVLLLWRWRGFRGDSAVLPALHLLTGFGLTLMLSLRDPLRDTLEFSKFSWGVAAGCLLLLLPLIKPLRYQRFSNWCYTPLLAAFALFAALLSFGSGPAGNPAKVNLGPFQPVEGIKILLVLFLAGYFTRQWERLRDLREKRFRWFEIPRFSHALPVLLAVVFSLLFFFVLKDLGPALVIGFLFLAMFGVARGRAGLPVLGIALLIAGVAVGYHLGKPPTVAGRISIWLSPWDNNVRGGDQLAHSMWALSTGGLTGSGPGRGDPGFIPAGNTDLVLPSIGEEWGFLGVAAIFCLFVFLIGRAFRIALRAVDEYGFFLALGLASLLGFEMLLISGGVLGAIPLSGVVSPFLSSGNTAMLANFLIFGLLLCVSSQSKPRETVVTASKPSVPNPPETAKPFRVPAYTLAATLAIAAVALLGRAAWLQVAHASDYLARDTHVFEQDGVKRPQHNPRLNSLAREIVRGNIYGRNGMLLATSDWNQLERRRAEYEKLGIDIDQACSRLDSRYYPFGAATAYLLGDLRTEQNFHATNASLIEHDYNARLQGYRDLSELAPLIRYRHQPNNPEIRQLFARNRDIHTSLDIRLQLRASAILHAALLKAHKEKGALVVLDPQSGDVLALASEPAFSASSTTPGDPAGNNALDRARYGQYPPGSTFKLVTAMAALTKDPALANQPFVCRRLPDGRAGAIIPGWRRFIKDDIGDSAHGALTMEKAIALSCNAYFAQLGVYKVGAELLKSTAEQLGISAGSLADLQQTLPFASYGQGPVLVTPFQMARVAAAIASGGAMPEGRWITGDRNTRRDPPHPVITPATAAFLRGAMRDVAVSGTARRAFAGLALPAAGKTGTAQLDQGLPHSWFAGFAPYSPDGPVSGIAFAVVIEHGGYGSSVAAPVARQLVEAARDLDIIHDPTRSTGYGNSGSANRD